MKPLSGLRRVAAQLLRAFPKSEAVRERPVRRMSVSQAFEFITHVVGICGAPLPEWRGAGDGWPEAYLDAVRRWAAQEAARVGAAGPAQLPVPLSRQVHYDLIRNAAAAP